MGQTLILILMSGVQGFLSVHPVGATAMGEIAMYTTTIGCQCFLILLTFASTSSLGSHCVTPLATPGHSRNSSVTSAAGGDAGAAPAGGALQRDLSRVTEESVSPFLGQD